MGNAVGGLLPLVGLRAVSSPFDLLVMFGLLILVGTVVNPPILMTTIRPIFGLAPVVFPPDAGTELYHGLGAIVLFGLLFTVFTALTFWPAMSTGVLSLAERRAAGS